MVERGQRGYRCTVETHLAGAQCCNGYAAAMTVCVRAGLVAVAFATCLVLPACREKGPAERAGEKIDKAGEKISDAIDPKGPAEKAGREIDKAVGD